MSLLEQHILQNQKVFLLLLLCRYNIQTFLAGSHKYLEQAIIQNSGGVADLRGDHILPTRGVIAYEAKIKVFPLPLTGDNDGIISAIAMASHIKGQEVMTLTVGFGSTKDKNANFSHDLIVLDKTYPLNITSNEYQRVGIYINQDTQQVGSIVNGYDQSYIPEYKLPSVFDNALFVASIMHISAQEAEGKELSLELITDRNALEFKYPEGTTDICGNLI